MVFLVLYNVECVCLLLKLICVFLYVLIKIVCLYIKFVSVVVLNIVNGWNGLCLVLICLIVVCKNFWLNVVLCVMIIVFW